MSSSDRWKVQLTDCMKANNSRKFTELLAKATEGQRRRLARRKWKPLKDDKRDQDLFPAAMPLHAAARYCRNDMIRTLVSMGAKANGCALNKKGGLWTALHSAAFNNVSSTIRLLLDLGADVRAEGTWEEYGGSPAFWAWMDGQWEAARTILDYGQADNLSPAARHDRYCEFSLPMLKASWEAEMCSAIYSDDVTKFRTLLFSRPGEIDLSRAVWTYGEAPLHQAAFYGQDEMVRLLVQGGANVDSLVQCVPGESWFECSKAHRYTCLHAVVLGCRKDGELEISKGVLMAKLLLAKGADPTLLGDHRCYPAEGTALDWANSDADDKKARAVAKVLAKHVVSLKQSPDEPDEYISAIKKELQEAMAIQERVKDRRGQIEQIKRDRERIRSEIKVLEQSARYRSSEELATLWEHIPPGSCPVCLKRPAKEVFYCETCEEVWFCQDCKGQLEKCPFPSCRVELSANPAKRNKTLERIILEKTTCN